MADQKTIEELDELVHDACGEIAASINNAGEEAQREFLKNGLPLHPDPVHGDRLLVAVQYLERAYDQVRHVYAEMKGINRMPTRVSQDLAQLISMHVSAPGRYAVTDPLGTREMNLAAGDEVKPRIQTNSLHNIPGRGRVLDCTILDDSKPSSFINGSIAYNGRIYRIIGVETSSSERRRVGFLVLEEARIPYQEPVNHMVQNPGGFPQWSTSGPVGPVEHARGFEGKVMDKAWEEQKKQPWTMGHDYADLELRVFALAIKELGLGEWYHELMEMVCFPDVDDLNYIRDNIKEHLNDKRVSFLRVQEDGEADPSGDTSVPEDDHSG